MPKYFIVIILLLALIVLVSSHSAYGLSFNFIGKILSVIKAVANFLKATDVARVIFPFGGKITGSGVACKIHYWVAITFPPSTFPGVPIPILGTKIDVSRPGIPASDIFTFPFISQIYANHKESQVGVWTLGLAFNKEFFKKSVLDPINNALGQIPPISVGEVTVYNFSLSCPNGGLIYKIGTSLY